MVFAWSLPCPANLHTQNAAQKADSLERLLATENRSDEELLNLYETLSLEHVETDHGRAVRYCREGIAVAGRLNKWRTVGELYKNMGYAYFCRNQYDSALICFDKVMEAAGRTSRQEDKDYLEIKSYLHKGIVSNANGRLHEEIDYYFKALKIAEKIGDKNNMQKLYGNIGTTYLALENDPLAEIYFTKGEKICLELNDSLLLSYHLTGLSHINCRQKSYAKALELATVAYHIIRSHPALIVDEFFVFLLMARIHEGMNDYDKALGYALDAVQSAKSLNSLMYLSWALETVAFVELNMGRYAESEQSALNAMSADSSDMVTNVKLFEYLTRANIMLGRRGKADSYLTRLIELTRELSNRNYQSSLSEMEVKYETEKKELRIKALEDEKRLILWLGITGGAVLLLGLAVFLLLWRWTIQKKRLAEQQVIQLQQEKQLIATQSLLDGELQERTRLARDLHDGLGSILAAAKYNLTDIRKTSDMNPDNMERLDQAISLMDNSMREMRRVAHHLMPESLNNAGLKQAIADFCKTVPVVNFTYYGDDSRIDHKQEMMIYRIMHELVSNALKHSGASHILVEIVCNADKIYLTVQDDGCGFDTLMLSKGMGLSNIRTRVAAYNGNLQMDSKEGVGTEVNIELKIEKK